MSFLQLTEEAVKQSASDLHVTAGVLPVLRIDGEMCPLNLPILKSEDTAKYVKQILNEIGRAHV